MSTYEQSDPCTDTLLDFIAGGVPTNKSGESGGNYSAYFGHVNATADFSIYSLSDIYALQAKMLKKDRRSTAVGRYQFLRGTLQSLQLANKLDNGEKFTHELQDRFAVALLVRRGYRQWWGELITDEELAHNCSLEWASLPDPLNDGKSHYDGDSVGNHASTSLEDFLDAIAQAKSLREASVEPPEVAPPLPMPPPRPATEPIAGIIKLGDRGKLVHLVQFELDILADGVFGKDTERTVKEFQRSVNIKATGQVDELTWDQLFKWPSLGAQKNG